MNQYQLHGNTLRLAVRRAPLFILIVLFFTSFLFFLLPIVGMAIYYAIKGEFHLGFIFVIFLFSLLGFYLLRIALWNRYGKEIITFHENRIDYAADFGWFSDGKNQIIIKHPLVFSILQEGSSQNNFGVLLIESGDSKIVCVLKLQQAELMELIEELNHALIRQKLVE